MDEVEQGLDFSRIRFLAKPDQEALNGKTYQEIKGSLNINLDNIWICHFICR